MLSPVEYGTTLFENNKSIYTSLETGIYINPHGLQYKAELYHRTPGYKCAGACAIWTDEIWGTRIYQHDGTTTGRMFREESAAREDWAKLINS